MLNLRFAANLYKTKALEFNRLISALSGHTSIEYLILPTGNRHSDHLTVNQLKQLKSIPLKSLSFYNTLYCCTNETVMEFDSLISSFSYPVKYLNHGLEKEQQFQSENNNLVSNVSMKILEDSINVTTLYGMIDPTISQTSVDYHAGIKLCNCNDSNCNKCKFLDCNCSTVPCNDCFLPVKECNVEDHKTVCMKNSLKFKKLTDYEVFCGHCGNFVLRSQYHTHCELDHPLENIHCKIKKVSVKCLIPECTSYKLFDPHAFHPCEMNGKMVAEHLSKCTFNLFKCPCETSNSKEIHFMNKREWEKHCEEHVKKGEYPAFDYKNWRKCDFDLFKRTREKIQATHYLFEVKSKVTLQNC